VVTPTIPKKRNEPPLTPAASVDDNVAVSASGSGAEERGKGSERSNDETKTQEHPKKKRRVVLTRLGDLEP